MRARPAAGCPQGGVRGAAGYSLLELLVSLLIVTLLLGGLYAVLFQTQTSFEAQQIAMTLRQEARIVMNGLTIELRMVGFDIGNLTEFITDADTGRLAFVSDIDGGSAEPPCDATIEGAPDGGAERITYRVFGGELLRSVDCWNGSAWSADSTDLPIARNVLSVRPLFRYFDADDVEIIAGAGGLTAAQRSQVRSIGIEIELEDPTVVPGKPNASFLVRTRVTLRNIE
ncbi:MAG: prepilin-type N-terminal cleavage/methylation domain-containing protein [Acidobacteria bacterium]|nr:prepilin-type N-terminal cleavage/methylation domain-containing protein [Acidobacteriota bacterium]